MKSLNKDNALDIVSKSEIESAYAKVKKHLPPSPMVQSHRLSKQLGANVYLKLESLQPTHSFKVRGAINNIASLDREAIKNGVVTASGGNHGLGVAYASQLLSSKATVYLPVKTPEIKVNALRSIGADVILVGDAWDEANQKALEHAEKNSLPYIHPFNDRLVMAGQGTIVKELTSLSFEPDLIIASIGGGGLISGIASANKHYFSKTKVIGVETIGADCMSRSLEADKIIELPKIDSIADSLGAKKTEPLPFHIIKQYVSEVSVVSDQLTLKAALALLEEDKLLVEPAAACCVAALESKEIQYEPNSNIVIIICGANISYKKLLSLAGAK